METLRKDVYRFRTGSNRGVRPNISRTLWLLQSFEFIRVVSKVAHTLAIILS